ncbi:hypothetical protein H0G86_009591 [Trichoderma simmonsii]|uniref:Uncharacterized protein n=1 Tax=Trichoderma simmonsii TaxID=1491479 RepID=A0A8G0LKU0_9HYPO|nr:hypothetical protein H0G86_009591 [Trichoderma simmonsii]
MSQRLARRGLAPPTLGRAKIGNGKGSQPSHDAASFFFLDEQISPRQPQTRHLGLVLAHPKPIWSLHWLLLLLSILFGHRLFLSRRSLANGLPFCASAADTVISLRELALLNRNHGS